MDSSETVPPLDSAETAAPLAETPPHAMPVDPKITVVVVLVRSTGQIEHRTIVPRSIRFDNDPASQVYEDQYLLDAFDLATQADVIIPMTAIISWKSQGEPRTPTNPGPRMIEAITSNATE